MTNDIGRRMMQIAVANADAAEAAYLAIKGKDTEERNLAFLKLVGQWQLLYRQARDLFPPLPQDRQPKQPQKFPIPPHDQAPTLASDPDDDIQLTKAQADELVARMDMMIPRMRAEEEHDLRRVATFQREHKGVITNADDIRRDLIDVLDRLESHLIQYHAKANRYMTTPAQVLLYCERTATYALRDYPRYMEGDGSDQVESLWDVIDRIHTNARAWATHEYTGDGTAVIAVIERHTKAALQGVYLDGDEVQS